jgi:hypothetical protein
MAEPTKVVMAVASPEVPAVDCIMPPPIIPPMPAIEMPVDPIMPFMTPSEASSIMAVTSPEEDVIMPTPLAYSDMAARVIP